MTIDPTNLAEYKCTCDAELTMDDHPQDCDLWLCTEYAQGFADWDPSTRTLCAVDHSWDDQEWDRFVDASDSFSAAPYADDLPQLGATATGAPLAWKCRHFQQPFTLPDGTVVYASSHHYHEPKEGDRVPDLGVYLDGIWQPVCVAFLIGCPDYGVPLPSIASVMHMANEALRVARGGGMVEVGCIGGHGRTGLFLAILTVLTMEEPHGAKAVAYVRDSYCGRAVESDKQEWYVEGMACERLGKPWPEPPKPKPIVVYQPQAFAQSTKKGGMSKGTLKPSSIIGAIEKLNKPKK